MNYNISLQQMNELAIKANSKKRKFSLEEMRKQAEKIKNNSTSSIHKQQH